MDIILKVYYSHGPLETFFSLPLTKLLDFSSVLSGYHLALFTNTSFFHLEMHTRSSWSWSCLFTLTLGNLRALTSIYAYMYVSIFLGQSTLSFKLICIPTFSDMSRLQYMKLSTFKTKVMIFSNKNTLSSSFSCHRKCTFIQCLKTEIRELFLMSSSTDTVLHSSQ